METIYGAELVLLSCADQDDGECVGALLTIATPLGKNWHWLRAEDYGNTEELLMMALGYAVSAGFTQLNVRECTMVKEYMFVDENGEDDEPQGLITLDPPF